jgi:uncharacterized phage protein gp47/JayE
MTYNEETAEVEPLTKEQWLYKVLDNGTEYWGDDITERYGSSIHHIYEPFAGRLAELEERLAKVQESLRLKDAEGQALDYKGEELGVGRKEKSRSDGLVTFESDSAVSKDYSIPKGTIVQTSSSDPIEFQTIEAVSLKSGETSVTSGIEARVAGSHGNVAAGSITQSKTSISGIDSIENYNRTSGGRDREEDDNYRNRIQNSVGTIQVSSLRKIYEDLNALDVVQQVRPIDNSADVANDGLNAHEVEIVVDAEPGHTDEIAQIIFDGMAMGANMVSGVHGNSTTGTAGLPNGQTFTIEYSVPTKTDIYIDIDATTTKDVNIEKVKNSIVNYIGGTKTTGQLVYGNLTVSDDVLYGEIEFAIREIEGVYDINSLQIGTSSTPSSTSNISIGFSERAVIDHSNISINTTLQ